MRSNAPAETLSERRRRCSRRTFPVSKEPQVLSALSHTLLKNFASGGPNHSDALKSSAALRSHIMRKRLAGSGQK
jgi:hypothetical protein